MPISPDPYPGVEMIQEPMVKQALRYVWDRIGDLRRTVKPAQGTLSPETKPQGLTNRDTNTRFFSTDFAREFVWDGTTWVDAPDAPARFQVAYFRSSPEPPIGWERCDGRAVLRSTSGGTTALFQTPIIPADSSGNLAYVRL